MTKDQLTREKVCSYIWELPREVTISLCPSGVLPMKEAPSQAQLLVSVQFSRSVVSDSAAPRTAERQASLSITNSRSPPKPMSTESMMPSSHLILCRPLLLLPSVFPSIRVFSNESALPIRWPKYWSFSFSIGPSNEHPGLISFRMDWLDLLAAQGTLKSLFQHHSSKASILQHSAFFMVQLSHPHSAYITSPNCLSDIVFLTKHEFNQSDCLKCKQQFTDVS